MNNMKKLIIILVLLSFSIAPFASATLYEFYREQGQALPSVAERAPTYELLFPGEKYYGEAEQNNKYEYYLRNPERTFGAAVKPFRPSGYSTTLASNLAEGGSETTLTVNSITLPDDTTLASTSFGDLLILTIGEGDTEEKISVTDLNTSTMTFTIGTRGLAYGSYTETEANKHRHLPGERVYVSDDDHFLNQQFVDLASDQTLTGVITFSQSPVIPTPGGSDLTYGANVEYVNNVATSGAADLSTTIKGLGEGATKAEASGGTATGGTGAPLVLLSEHATSTFDIATTSIMVTEDDGYLNQQALDLTEDFSFSGELTSDGNTTLASTTITGTTTANHYISLEDDPVQDSHATRKDYVDQRGHYTEFGNGFTDTSPGGSSETATTSITTSGDRPAQFVEFTLMTMSIMQTGSNGTRYRTYKVLFDLANQKYRSQLVASTDSGNFTSCALQGNGDGDGSVLWTGNASSMSPGAFSTGGVSPSFVNYIVSDEDSIDVNYTLNENDNGDEGCIYMYGIIIYN